MTNLIQLEAAFDDLCLVLSGSFTRKDIWAAVRRTTELHPDLTSTIDITRHVLSAADTAATFGPGRLLGLAACVI